MTVVIFVGPTLRNSDVSDHLEATILPPVQQGDVYRVARDKPRAIGIIDGFFDGVPSVWHKEILWAIEQGITVFGSASMGALRAAELSDFGMIGVGQIFEDYRNGTLSDDDEVAVLHSPAELGFQALSEPMVSIRATVARAVSEDILTRELAGRILEVAKELNYRERAWTTVIERVDGHFDLSGFASWLSSGRVDAKGDDARQMLATMAEYLRDNNRAAADHRVERTLAWRDLCARIDAETEAGPSKDIALVNELRLTPDRFAAIRERAALTLLANDESLRLGYVPDREALVRKMSEHRVEAGLPRQTDLMAWLQTNNLDPQQYESFLADRSRTDQVMSALQDRMDTAILDELRRAGDYPEMWDRAARKSRVLAAQDPNPDPGAPASAMRMLIWYFETQLDQRVPDDLESYAIALGLSGRDALIELIEAEFLFCQLDGGPTDDKPSDMAG